MLTIRLQRTGKRNQPDFRIVLAEKTAPVNRKIEEILGSYNPRKKLFRLKNEERFKYWLSQNVRISPTVHNLLVTNKLLAGGKVKAFSIPKKKEEAKPVEVPAAAQPPKTEPAPAAETPAITVSSETQAPASNAGEKSEKPDGQA